MSPEEFWLGIDDPKKIEFGDMVHVRCVDHDKKKVLLKREDVILLRETLMWYADRDNYGTSWRKVCEDGGHRARLALGLYNSEGETK